MSINKVVLLSAFLMTFSSACSSDLFITHNGNMPSNERIAQIRVGQSKSEILNILGSPSSVVSLDRNQWIYMSSDIKRVAFFAPKEVDRDVLTIQFNDQGKVSEIERLRNQSQHQQNRNSGTQSGFLPQIFRRRGTIYALPHQYRSQQITAKPRGSGL